MNAIVPVNVAALRVNANDASKIVGGFKGRTAAFEKLPYPSGAAGASTGDAILRPLESASTPLDPLGPGIHLHWELPDFFRRGVQPPDGSDVVFPHAPNRWLVVRYLRRFDAATGTYGPVAPKCWIVESDFVTPRPAPDADGIVRPAVPVPVAVTKPAAQPFLFMGRVLDYAAWDPGSETPSQFLSGYEGPDGKPLFLTSIGFVGPGFSSYYPECASVFGFWDHFKDVPALSTAIAQNAPVQFAVSYQVFGWVQDAAFDPLAGFADVVRAQYDDYVAQCAAENVPVVTTPAEVFVSAAQQRFRWDFRAADVAFTLASDDTLATIDLPAATLCSGIVQDVVWNMLANPSTTSFLSSDQAKQQAIWQDQVEVAVGNTTVEALSALLKRDLADPVGDPNVLTNYEYLLDALQLGLLRGLEAQPTKLVALEEALHAGAFSQLDGGYVWAVRQPQLGSDPQDPDLEITLPLALAEQLAALNQAQKSYDQGRAALAQRRRQLFMDWTRYVKMYAGGATDPNVPLGALSAFLSSSDGSELSAVVAAGGATGILQYTADDSGALAAVRTASAAGSLAAAVCGAYANVQSALSGFPSWQLQAAPGPAFWLPTDPVVLLEGDRMEPVRRNGASADLAPRLTPDLLDTLGVAYGGATFAVAAAGVSGPPPISAATPMRSDVQALVAEAFLLAPMLADALAAALQAQGGSGNPAVANGPGFAAALRAAQGGSSPLEGGSAGGLYAAAHQAGYVPAANPVQTVSAPLALAVTFTNAAGRGWAPDPIGWNAQQALPEFSPARVDPFLPVSLIWTVRFFPLQPSGGAAYGPGDLTAGFALDADGVDYVYTAPGGTFATTNPVTYSGSVVLSKKPVYSLTAQIDDYEQTYPVDPADTTLSAISAAYQSRKLLAQGLSGFNVDQLLRTFTPQIAVQDLTKGLRDAVTTAIDSAARATAGDNWYDFGFNAQAPGLLQQNHFGPLRAGFAEIAALEVVDAFGQRMQLAASATNPDTTMRTTVALTMQPAASDGAHRPMVYLAPRLLAPARLWFHWLSAAPATNFVEMNSHPATSPVCGWILPDHLENSLFFYDAGGAPIGSFGIEHGALTYRTRPGNAANPGDDLATDLGPPVNPHAAAFMRYVGGRSAAFLIDLMASIASSDGFINPANFAQNPSLAVLIGRPLALTRAVVGLETSGGVLPLSQASASASDAFPQAVRSNSYDYAARQQFGSANLGGVRFPLRLGELANVDDGLVGFLLEAPGDAPYSTLYAPAAPSSGANGVVQPTAATVQLALNAAPTAVTMLVDPRAGVHATTGILPVASLAIPPDQYLQVMQSLAISFAALPVLAGRQGLRVPLPLESGYRWSWMSPPGGPPPVDQPANAANGLAVYDYTPQTLLEGWVQLAPDPAAQSLAATLRARRAP